MIVEVRSVIELQKYEAWVHTALGSFFSSCSISDKFGSNKESLLKVVLFNIRDYIYLGLLLGGLITDIV